MKNYDFDFNSKKYIILLVLVCFTFFLFIIKAYEYIPDKNIAIIDNDINKINKVETSVENKVNSAKNNMSDNEDSDSNENSENTDQINNSDDNNIDIIEIDAPKGVNQEDITPISDNNTNNSSADSDIDSKEYQALKSLFNGKKYKSEGDYSKALNEFQTTINNTDDSEILSSAYEGMAELYAIQKKYGTALTFANKAYNLSPSYTKELLIAKIYFKTGDTNKAINSVNEFLKRGFN